MYELKKPVALVGMMGSGKSAVGKAISSALRVPFNDADDEIEYAARLSIPEIFERHGENFFRDKENQIITRLLKGPPSILATGGGAFINKNIRSSIKNYGVSVWLDADIETLWNRVKHKKSRPLLKTKNPKETLTNIYKDRLDTYSKAEITISSHEKSSLEEMADLVIKSLLSRNYIIERT